MIYIYCYLDRLFPFITNSSARLDTPDAWSCDRNLTEWLYVRRIFYHTATSKPRVNVEILTRMYYFCFIYIRGAFNKFPDLFCTGIKIVVDSEKFSMLLLYILWDDWPIFMISDSNEQQLQGFEYILLKPDFHSWWISKMQWGHLEERYAIKFCFKTWKKGHRNVWNASHCFSTILHESSISFWVA